jgi:hypothetical protein
MTETAKPREDRLRRSLKRLGYELVDLDVGEACYCIRRDGRRLHEAESDLLGLSLGDVEKWIKQQARAGVRPGRAHA